MIVMGDAWESVDVFSILACPMMIDPPTVAYMANLRCRELTGQGFSAQAWGLRAKLLEANEYREGCGHPIYEVHPELAFGAATGIGNRTRILTPCPGLLRISSWPAQSATRSRMPFNPKDFG